MTAKMLDVSEIATLLQCSEPTIRRLIDKGELKGERLSDTSPRRVSMEALEEYATRRNLTLDWSLVR